MDDKHVFGVEPFANFDPALAAILAPGRYTSFVVKEKKMLPTSNPVFHFFLST